MASAPHVMIVESRYYPDIANALTEGAIAELEAQGATYKRYTVPTIFEVPLVIRYAIRAVEIFPARRRFDGYLALGCELKDKGSTDYPLVKECAHTVQQLALQFSLAVGFGIITAETTEEAWQQAATKQGNRGAEAAQTCLELIKLKADFNLFPRV
jgi:6,7-dimethyl-8-ribityllumazine synthase